MASKEDLQKFVNTFYTGVLKRSKATGIPFNFAISQIARESGFGLHAPNYNFMGIKGNKDNGALLWTYERYKDRAKANSYPAHNPAKDYQKNGYWYVYVKSWFRAFKNVDEALDYYFNLLQNKRYISTLEEYKEKNLTWQQYGKLIIQKGYATTDAESYSNGLNAFLKQLTPYFENVSDPVPEETPKKKSNLIIWLLAFSVGSYFLIFNKSNR